MVNISIVDRCSFFVLTEDKIEFSIIFTNDDTITYKRSKNKIIVNPQCTAALIPIERTIREIITFNTILIFNNSNVNNESIFEYFVGNLQCLSKSIVDIYFIFY